MQGDRPSCGSHLCEDEHRDDRAHAGPAARLGEGSAKPHLDIETPERVLEVTKRALHLDDQQDTGARVERQQIHTPAVSIVVEAHLGTDYPTRAGEGCRSLVLEPGMGGIDETVELLALPANGEIDRGPQRLGDTLDRAKWDSSDEAALNSRDRRAGDGGSCSEVRLTPPTPPPEMADRARHVRSNHDRMIVQATYQPVTLRTMPDMTYEQLLQLARHSEGKTLETVTGKKFTVGIYRDCPFFTPASSGYGQSDGRKAAERFLARYNESGSLRPGDYADVTRNASYFIGMLMHGNVR